MHSRADLLRIFCIAAESSSFRDAATRLATSPQTVTRAIQTLEQQLGELLFHRNTRQIRITSYGQQFAEQARAALHELDALFQHNTRHKPAQVSGRVGITAPRSIGRRFLVSMLEPLLREYPQLQLKLQLEDELTDSVQAQIDLGIRIGPIRDRRYIAKSAAKVPFYVVATPELLARTTAPEQLADLHSKPLSALVDRKNGRAWPWLFRQGQTLFPEAPAFICDDPETELQAVLAGLAYGQLPGYLAIPHLQTGELVSVLAAHAPPPWDLFLYRPQRGPVPARVRIVHDHLLKHFANNHVFPASLHDS